MNVEDLGKDDERDRHGARIDHWTWAADVWCASVMFPRIKGMGDTRIEAEAPTSEAARAALIEGLEKLKGLYAAEVDHAIAAARAVQIKEPTNAD